MGVVIPFPVKNPGDDLPLHLSEAPDSDTRIKLLLGSRLTLEQAARLVIDGNCKLWELPANFALEVAGEILKTPGVDPLAIAAAANEQAWHSLAPRHRYPRSFIA